MFDPNRAGRKGPVAARSKTNGEVGVWDREPAGFDRVVGPEWHVDVVGDDAGRGRERIESASERVEVREGAGGGQSGGKGRAIRDAVIHDPFDSGIVAAPGGGAERVTIGGVHTESGKSGGSIG